MYAEDKKIDEFISSKIDKFEFSKGKISSRRYNFIMDI